MSQAGGPRVSDYLGHMLMAISRIRRYVRDIREADFIRDAMIQDALIRTIEIMGEAARSVERVDPVFAAAHREIPWSVIYAMRAMRNRVAHGYFDVDLHIIWQTVRTDLPVLEGHIRSLLAPEAEGS